MKLTSYYLEHLDSLGLRHANRLKSQVDGYNWETFSDVSKDRSTKKPCLIMKLNAWDRWSTWRRRRTFPVTKEINWIVSPKVLLHVGSRFRRIVTAFPPWRFGFDARQVRLRFMADKVYIRHVSLWALLFFPFIITPPALLILFRLDVVISWRTNGRGLGNFLQQWRY
jgi:hypothetical protein